MCFKRVFIFMAILSAASHVGAMRYLLSIEAQLPSGVPSYGLPTTLLPTRATTLMSMDDDSFSLSSEQPIVAEDALDVPVDGAKSLPQPSIALLKQKLLLLAASTRRGESATIAEKDQARALIDEIEALNPSVAPARQCEGTWELVFSDTQLFRSSPFFAAGRAVCADGPEAKRYDVFCDLHRSALAISEIGKVRQIVSYGEDDTRPELVSEFEVCVGAVPFLSDFVPLRYSGGLPLTISGAIVSTASLESVGDTEWSLLMDTVEVKGSNVPLLRQLLDSGLRLESRQLGRALEAVLPTYANPRPIFRTSFVDDYLRISRDQDGKIFVYSRVNEKSKPTDFSDLTADFGINGLVQNLASLYF